MRVDFFGRTRSPGNCDGSRSPGFESETSETCLCFGSTKWGTSAAGDLEAAERRGSTGARSAVSTASSHVMDLRRARSLGTGPIHLGGSSEEDLCAQKFLFSCARERDVARSL